MLGSVLTVLLSGLLITQITAASAAATPLSTPPRDGPEGPVVHWTTSQFSKRGNLAIEHGYINVPADYSSPGDHETISIRIARSKAIHQPSKGTILINFGEPGTSGVSSLVSRADYLHRYRFLSVRDSFFGNTLH